MTACMHDPPCTHGSPHIVLCRWSPLLSCSVPRPSSLIVVVALRSLSQLTFGAGCPSWLPLVCLPLAAYSPMMTTMYWVCVPRGVGASGRTVSHSLRSAPTACGLYSVCPQWCHVCFLCTDGPVAPVAGLFVRVCDGNMTDI